MAEPGLPSKSEIALFTATQDFAVLADDEEEIDVVRQVDFREVNLLAVGTNRLNAVDAPESHLALDGAGHASRALPQGNPFGPQTGGHFAKEGFDQGKRGIRIQYGGLHHARIIACQDDGPMRKQEKNATFLTFRPGTAGQPFFAPTFTLEGHLELLLLSRMTSRLVCCLALLLGAPLPASEFASIPTEPTEGDRLLNDYFARETRRLATRNASFLESVEDWPSTQANLRRQLFEMLGLQPLPARSDLKAEITGTVERDGVIVEKIVFQSSPGLYVTANFYRPAQQDGPLPTILYVCGHGRSKIDGVSYGNKVTYQHHGNWFAQNGYTCLILDTLQMGEIEGSHHGTHNLGRWWWNSRGYTSAGVEAWNGIRALDYLETRPEVDKTKFGVTGRSGGGASTLWIAALDERIRVAAPAAGITSMHNHIVDGCVEGHCDCMFMVNTYRWDFPLVTALISPRPLMILNTDKDRIFPVDGVVDVYLKTRKVYEAMGALNHIGLAFYEGPHLDTQPLRVAAFHWFERHLKGLEIREEIPNTLAPKPFQPTELKVLASIPNNERNTFIDEYFTKRAPEAPTRPENSSDWEAEKALVIGRLQSKVFRGWPATPGDLLATEDFREEKDGLVFSKWSFETQGGLRLPLYLAHSAGHSMEDLERLVLVALDESRWDQFLDGYGQLFPAAFPGLPLPQGDRSPFEAEKAKLLGQPWGIAYLPPRGIGPTAWTSDEKERTHIRRRFALLGQTLDGMRIWDLRRGIQTLRTLEGASSVPLHLQASSAMAGNALYAALFEPNLQGLELEDLPSRHQDGPELLNVLRFTDIPQVTAMVADRIPLRLQTDQPEAWDFLKEFAKALAWPEDRVQVQAKAAE